MATPYQIIAKNFSIKGFKNYQGPVVLADDAIFLVPLKDATATAVASQFGLIGMLIHWMMTRNKDLAISHDLAVGMDRIPDEIVGDPDWPVTKHRGAMMIVPKAMVREIKMPWWGGISFRTEKHQINISPAAFSRGKVKRAMQDLEWPVG